MARAKARTTGGTNTRGAASATRARGTSPVIGVIMGSRSDWETMRHATETLAALGVPFEARVVSAHRVILGLGPRIHVFLSRLHKNSWMIGLLRP